MPLISLTDELSSLDMPQETNVLSNAPLNSQPEGYVAPERPDPSLLDTTASAFRQSNFISSWLFNQEGSSEPDPNFNAYEKIKGTKYEQYYDRVYTVNNDEHLKAWMFQIDQEERDRQTLSDAGWLGVVSSVSAGVSDPTLLIPGVNIVKGARAARIVKNAIGGAATAAGAVAASESVLANTQVLRDEDDAIYNTAGAAIIGGILGGGLSAWVSKAEVDSAKVGVKKIVTGDINKQQKIVADTSAGAAQVPYTRYKVEGLPDNVVKSSQVPFMHSPALDMLTDPFETTRKTGQGLFENRLYIGEKSDVAVDTQIKLDSIEIYNMKKAVDEQYKTYVDAKTNFGLESYYKAKTSGKLTYNQFSEEVAKSMRRGDIHSIPQVANTVKIIREQVNKVTADLQKAGLLSEQLDLKGSTSWLTRIWNKDAIVADRSNFTAKLQDDFIKKGMPEDEVMESADDIYTTLVKGQDELSLLQNKGVSSLETGKPFLKERKLDINDAEYEKWLKNDGIYLMENYIKEARTLIRMKEYLNKNGYSSVKSILDDLDSEYSIRRSHLSGADAAKLAKQYKKSRERIRDSFQIIIGKYRQRKMGDDVLGALSKYQYVRLLTFQVLSSLTDIGAPVLKYGLGKTLMNGYINSLKEFTIGASKMAKEDLKAMGVGMELDMNQTIRSIVDPGFYQSANNRLNKYGNSVVDTFSKANLSVYWNNFHKRIVGHIIEAEMIKLMQKKTALTNKEWRYLETFGIGERERLLIRKELDDFKIKGTYIPNIKAWRSEEAKEVFSAAVLKEVDSTILGGASRSDAPWLIQKYQLASTVFQFHNYFSSLTARILLPALQVRDANVAQGILALVSLGGLQYVIREKLKGRTPNMDPSKLIAEGISRSGLLGMWTDPVFGIALRPFNAASRYSAAPRLDSILLGPTFAMANDIASLYF